MDTKESLKLLENKALVDLSKIFEDIGEGEAQTIARNLEGYAVWLIRAACYLESRSYGMSGHETAVKNQNKMAARVRKALGIPLILSRILHGEQNDNSNHLHTTNIGAYLCNLYLQGWKRRRR